MPSSPDPTRRAHWVEAIGSVSELERRAQNATKLHLPELPQGGKGADFTALRQDAPLVGRDLPCLGQLDGCEPAARDLAPLNSLAKC
jgi:hypothetical protein